VFGFLLDDSPLPPGESSSSALTAMAFHAAGPGGKDSGGDSSSLQEVEKGLLMLIASDTPGLQVRSWQITLLLVQFEMGCGHIIYTFLKLLCSSRIIFVILIFSSPSSGVSKSQVPE
jgi:hypothetical protein